MPQTGQSDASAPAKPPEASSRPWALAAVGVLALAAAAGVLLTLRPTPAPADGATARTAPVPGAMDQVLNAISTLKRDGEFAKARTILAEAIAQHPEEQRLYVEQAEVLVALQQTKEAYAAYEQAIASGEPTHAIQLAAGTVASMLGNTPRAREHFEAAQQLDKTDWKAPLFLAQMQIKQGDSLEASKNLLLAVKLKPDSAAAWGSLADLELRENKISLAAQHVAKARELEPDSTLWRVLDARILKRDNKPSEALEVLMGLDAAQRLEPGVLQTMGECLGLLSRPADAAVLYSDASDAQPSRGDLALAAAQWWERASQPANGVKYAQRAAEVGEEHAAELVARLKSLAESRWVTPAPNAPPAR